MSIVLHERTALGLLFIGCGTDTSSEPCLEASERGVIGLEGTCPSLRAFSKFTTG